MSAPSSAATSSASQFGVTTSSASQKAISSPAALAPAFLACVAPRCADESTTRSEGYAGAPVSCDLQRPVSRPVVGDHELPVALVRLGGERLELRRDRLLRVSGSHDDRYKAGGGARIVALGGLAHV